MSSCFWRIFSQIKGIFFRPPTSSRQNGDIEITINNDELSSTKKSLSLLTERAAKLQQELEERKREYEVALKNLEIEKVEKEKAQRECKDVEGKLLDISKELNDLKEKGKALLQINKQVEEELNEKKGEVEQLSGQNKELIEKCSTLKKEMEESKKTFETNHLSLEKNLQESKKNLKDVMLENENLLTLTSELNGKVEDQELELRSLRIKMSGSACIINDPNNNIQNVTEKFRMLKDEKIDQFCEKVSEIFELDEQVQLDLYSKQYRFVFLDVWNYIFGNYFTEQEYDDISFPNVLLRKGLFEEAKKNENCSKKILGFIREGIYVNLKTVIGEKNLDIVNKTIEEYITCIYEFQELFSSLEPPPKFLYSKVGEVFDKNLHNDRKKASKKKKKISSVICVGLAANDGTVQEKVLVNTVFESNSK